MLSIRDQQIVYVQHLLELLLDQKEETVNNDELRHFSHFWMREMMRRHHPVCPLSNEEAEQEKNLSYYTLGWFLYEMVGTGSSEASPISEASSSDEGL